MNNLSPIPRVPSRAPNKNTIEWEITDKVKVGFMLVEKAGYLFVAKVKTDKKHWWSSSHKTFVTSGWNIFEVIPKIQNFLKQYGFYIDPNTIEFGEVVGFTNQCPKCGSKNIKADETENDFARWKPEGEKAVKQDSITKRGYSCRDCKHTWEVRY